MRMASGMDMAVLIREQQALDDSSGSDDDHSDGQLSDFELRRLDGMRSNAAELQRLNPA